MSSSGVATAIRAIFESYPATKRRLSADLERVALKGWPGPLPRPCDARKADQAADFSLDANVMLSCSPINSAPAKASAAAGQDSSANFP